LGKDGDKKDQEEPAGRRLLVLAQEAARARDAAGMVAALQASGYLAGLVRRLQKQWPRLPREDIDDCVAESVSGAYEAVGRGQRILQLGGWLWKVAYNKATDRWERIRLQRPADDDLAHPGESPMDPGERIRAEEEGAQRRSEVIQLARRLLPKVGHGQVLAVTELLIEAVEAGEPDLPAEVVADTLGITAAAARSLMSRGLERLHRAARDDGIEFEFSSSDDADDNDAEIYLETETDR
jgi:DNA-directed RNA polymerase specialized sigma24 family protein